MRIAVLGSGSKGNAIAVTAAETTLLVDAGFGLRSLAGRARKAGVNLTGLVGVVLTHEHHDHARGAAPLARKSACPVYASRGTLAALAPALDNVTRVAIDPRQPVSIGPFTITACRTSHDAAEPLALAVVGEDGAKIGLAYDLGHPTTAVRQLLQDSTCLIVEANHDEAMLRSSSYPPVLRERIAGPAGHLSNRVAARFLAGLHHDGLRSVILAHLSEECNGADLAVAEVRSALEEVGFDGRLMAARQAEPLAPVTVSDDPGQLEFWAVG
jgi:phosphoribosyl 1,2-cyclic phosphodiesterase